MGDLKPYITIGVFLLGTLAFGQPNQDKLRDELKDASWNEKFEVANSLMYDKLYVDALFVWNLMLEEQPTNANINYKIGMCYIYLNKEVEALPYFEKAQYGISKNYNPYSPLETHAPPELLYYLAKSNHAKGHVDTAYYQYEYFLSSVKKKHINYDLAELGIKQCKVAKQLMASPEKYVIKNIGGVVNTEFPEYSPVITIDGSALFFTSKRLRSDSSNVNFKNKMNGQYFEDVYVSYRSMDGQWSKPMYLNFCRPYSNDASISVSPDGQVVFVYQDLGNGDIYLSQLQDTVFMNIQPFPAEELNSDAWETHATMSADGNYIYFVSDREGGLGGKDIWRLKKLPDGSWSKAMNLGAPVNTPYDEESPFMGADNHTMYFSSNGPKSMGGYDIFVSQMDETERWSEPVNMGYPLNSVDDDIFYTTTADGHTGFYSSDKLDGKGDKDIYIVQSENSYITNVAIFTGYILTADHSMIPAGITIMVKDLTDDTPPRKYSPRRRDGGYVLNLQPCHTYELKYYLDTNQFYQTELYVPCNSSYQEINHELLLDMINFEASELVNMPLQDTRWEFVNTEHVDQLEGKQITIFEDNEVIYEEFINKYGQFPYKELDASKNHLMKIEENELGFCDDLKLNLIDSSNNILDSYTFNDLCETDPRVSQFSSSLKNPIFEHHFGYNKDKFGAKNELLVEYVKGIKELVDNGQSIRILISASASKVPTGKYSNNYDLAAKRLAYGKKTLLKVLTTENVDLDKVELVENGVFVQGPDYNNDAREKAEVYERYQYIKFEIQIEK